MKSKRYRIGTNSFYHYANKARYFNEQKQPQVLLLYGDSYLLGILWFVITGTNNNTKRSFVVGGER